MQLPLKPISKSLMLWSEPRENESTALVPHGTSHSRITQLVQTAPPGFQMQPPLQLSMTQLMSLGSCVLGWQVLVQGKEGSYIGYICWMLHHCGRLGLEEASNPATGIKRVGLLLLHYRHIDSVTLLARRANDPRKYMPNKSNVIEEKRGRSLLMKKLVRPHLMDTSDDNDDTDDDEPRPPLPPPVLRVRRPHSWTIIDAMDASYFDAVVAIMSEERVGVAPVGERLGRWGALAWLVVATTHTVYLFDVATIGLQALLFGTDKKRGKRDEPRAAGVGAAAHNVAEDVASDSAYAPRGPVNEVHDAAGNVNGPVNGVLDAAGTVNGPVNGVLDAARNVNGPVNGVCDAAGNVNGPVNGVCDAAGNVNGPVNGVCDAAGNVNGPVNGVLDAAGNVNGPVNGVRDAAGNVNGPVNGVLDAAGNVNRPVNGVLDAAGNINRPVNGGLNAAGNVTGPVNGVRDAAGDVRGSRAEVTSEEPGRHIEIKNERSDCSSNVSDIFVASQDYTKDEPQLPRVSGAGIRYLGHVLEDPGVEIVVHDARNLQDLLLHQAHLVLKNVFDTQAAEIYLHVIQEKGKCPAFVPLLSTLLLRRLRLSPRHLLYDRILRRNAGDSSVFFERPMSEETLESLASSAMFLCELRALQMRDVLVDLAQLTTVHMFAHAEKDDVMRVRVEEHVVPESVQRLGRVTVLNYTGCAKTRL
ncbi:uncharacterized protein LOC108668403 isoform X2 [Hyalella azteca]|uniref:Uncharacterized protein LOC108668403 isoform X2 n=1 Tax=Hyalella azteca TaxID=294128 RepID=A0A8B7NBY0_HYAAZ|nr:uncharacterized protein LOC108668403 isoform X2 [Hyalella azteca]